MPASPNATEKKRRKPLAGKTVKLAPTPEQMAARQRLQRIARHVTALLVCIGAAVAGVYFLKQYVDKKIVFLDGPPAVVFKDRPVWMSDYLCEELLASVQPLGAHSAFDRGLLVDVAVQLERNPWIKGVRQVRRAYGRRPGDTIEIDCDFRAPVAMVHWKDYFWLVDGDGVKLPEQFTAQQVPHILKGRDGQMNIRIIEGVAQPPVESGRKWPGDDLTAGLDLVKLLYGKPFAEAIMKVDVANFAGRNDPKEAQLTLETSYGTAIKWGRPINAKDFFVEVSTAQKLKYLEQVQTQYGRIDAGQPWIDIRFDRITYPSIANADAASTNNP
jgi:hypothetical protein